MTAPTLPSPTLPPPAPPPTVPTMAASPSPSPSPPDGGGKSQPSAFEIHRGAHDAVSSSSSPSPGIHAGGGILSSILRDHDVYLGGSSMGKGFRRAARYYLRKRAPTKAMICMGMGGSGAVRGSSATALPPPASASALLNDGVEPRVEDPFYVIDLGVIVSQYYQWKKHFPRVTPYYAVKCNPDPVLVQTLATLGCNFDCASREEVRLVQSVCVQAGLAGCPPDIIFANPTKARSHVIEAVCRGVRLMTFDNVDEVHKCAAVSKHIQLLLRIITDDSGSQCRLSSKYGAPRSRWGSLLSAAKDAGLDVVGVSFHVGSGCRDASRYELALRDARDLFDLASSEYGIEMTILDIGGGFPGETHSLYNPAKVFGDPTLADADLPPLMRRKYTIDEELQSVEDGTEDVDDGKEGYEKGDRGKDDGRDEDGDDDNDSIVTGGSDKTLMFFSEIAEAITPVLDDLFPPDSGVHIIAEPGRYLVAAAATLVASVIGARSNATDATIEPNRVSDGDAAFCVDAITRAEEDVIVTNHGKPEHPVVQSIVEELSDYSKLYAKLSLANQEIDVYTDHAELSEGRIKDAAPVLAPPMDRLRDGDRVREHHTVEGMQMGIVSGCYEEPGAAAVGSDGAETGGGASSSPIGGGTAGTVTLAAAGEAAVSGLVTQAVADSAPLQDDYAYYVNAGVYGDFNNILFDHATVRPRRLKVAISKSHRIVETERENGLKTLEAVEEHSSDDEAKEKDDLLYPSTVFGPTCDSMDIIARSILLPKMNIGDWIYCQNMGAYTYAAASSFNGFSATEKFYVCSVQPEHFERFAVGIPHGAVEEKKTLD